MDRNASHYVPATVRNRNRMIGIGEPVLPRYERIVFEKSLVAPQGGTFPGTRPFLSAWPGLFDGRFEAIADKTSLLRMMVG